MTVSRQLKSSSARALGILQKFAPDLIDEFNRLQSRYASKIIPADPPTKPAHEMFIDGGIARYHRLSRARISRIICRQIMMINYMESEKEIAHDMKIDGIMRTWAKNRNAD